jgi:hypothetical protein
MYTLIQVVFTAKTGASDRFCVSSFLKPSIITKPGKSAFDFPACAIAAQGSVILRGQFFPVDLMGHDQLDAATLEKRSRSLS